MTDGKEDERKNALKTLYSKETCIILLIWKIVSLPIKSLNFTASEKTIYYNLRSHCLPFLHA